MKTNYKVIGMIAVILIAAIFMAGCTQSTPAPQATADSGVQKATASVQTDASGHTVEQNNIIEKYKQDNNPATIRYVYLISPYDHKVIYKTTVKGKITSSGKRLTPASVAASPYMTANGYTQYGGGIVTYIGGNSYYSSDVIQDDGTYGNSMEYLYGFAMDGSMIQIYTGGSVVLVSTKPLTMQDGVISMQSVDDKGNPITT